MRTAVAAACFRSRSSLLGGQVPHFATLFPFTDDPLLIPVFLHERLCSRREGAILEINESVTGAKLQVGRWYDGYRARFEFFFHHCERSGNEHICVREQRCELHRNVEFNRWDEFTTELVDVTRWPCRPRKGRGNPWRNAVGRPRKLQ